MAQHRVSGGSGSNIKPKETREQLAARIYFDDAPAKPPSDTPQSDRTEQDEFALLANEFRSTAARLRETADACRLTGRPSMAVRYEVRAWAMAQAGLCCEQKLEESRRDAG